MGLFDGYAFLPTQTDAAGRRVFFPYGMFGRGRVLTDDGILQRLRMVHVVMVLGVASALAALAKFGFSISAFLGASALTSAVYGYAIHRTVRHLPVSTAQYDFLGTASQLARAFGQGLWWVSLAVWIILAAKFVGMLADRGFTPTDAFVAAFLAIGMAVSVFSLRACLRK